MTDAPEMFDLDGPLAGAPTTTGIGTSTTASDSNSKSRWSSTSSTETDSNDFWHDSTLSNHFYTTQDTTCTLESFDFNDDNLFFGPFDSCSTGQDISHVANLPTAGTQSIDFASTAQVNPCLPEGFNPMISDLEAASMATDGGVMDLSWSALGVDNDPTSLKDKINNALIRGDGGRLFLPDDAFEVILSYETVLSELRRHFPAMPAQDIQRLAAQITAKDTQGWLPFNGLLRTFAVLVMLDQVDKIIGFLQEGVTDVALPLTTVRAIKDGIQSLTIDLRRKDNPNLELRCFKGWSHTDLEAFEKLQWRFLSPIFSDLANKQDLVDLEEKTVLPYIETWENKKQDHYKGGNSEVWKVKIHESHHNFQNLPTVIPNNPYFAIKRLKSKDEEDFHREVRNLQRLHNAEHPNLLSLLATYKYRGYYHLVFPWAEGDLRRLWQSTENPQPGKDEMRWLANQCASIASALKSVHAGAESWLNSTTDPAGQQRLMNKIGIHGDIKPENIFIFSKGQQNKSKELAMGPPTTKKGTPTERSSRSGSPSSVADDRDLVIGDFGGGAFYDATTNPDPLRQITVAYRPPEYDTKLRPVSRSWDVWGLGCTYLEFVTWFLLGPSGLSEFAKRRTTKTAAGKMSDEYFETFIDPSQTGGIGAILKGSVLAWINDLARHQNASPFIRDFLDFITHRMFIIENASRTRASGEEVAEHMNKLSEKCRGDDIYCLPIPTAKAPWDVESVDSSITVVSSTTPEDFNFDFSAATEDVAGAPNAAWDFPSMDLSPLGQWNTAPIIPGALSFHNSLSCADMLGTWNYTAPVAWNVDDSMSPSSIDSRNRKRKLEGSKDIERRVSPKTSTSPQASTSSTIDESAADIIGKKPAEKRFACPYYKNNPGKFRQKRTCCGPGWPTVHRVKEHLYRCHTIGKHTCSRCLTKCKSAAELLAHQRAAVPCETRTDAFSEGTMLPNQEEALRIKKRVPPNTTEEQRWYEVYMVLFPGEQADALPAPFYEDEALGMQNSVDGSSKQDSASDTWLCKTSEYEQYLSRGLPPRVQRELEREVQREFGFVGDAAQTRKVVDMVQKLQLRLFRQFERESKGSQPGDHRDNTDV
ncbi:putative serine/threonine-protein kinase tsuA [Cytospora mali]|uniref:Serine/threonine-protein kinase tsuA n=1 Tax=Cytospora mali TaxID=578113 RepID=A0A194UYD6_CYTMA|nr:putative serine/threonine-protein kinase tsuA [Valsa mali var. pyri (nom. inval.)]